MRQLILTGSSLLLACAIGFGHPSAAAQHLARLDRSALPITEQSTRATTAALPKLLKELSRRYQVDFNYNYRHLSQKTGSLSLPDRPNATLESLLTELLGPLDLTFERFQGKTVLIYPKSGPKPTDGTQNQATTADPSATPGAATEAPKEAAVVAEIRVSGQVTSETGEGLPGVTVLVKGSTRGTNTDTQGRYTLAVPDERAVLVYSFVGYLSQEIVVGNRSAIDIKLAPDTKSLTEVVVVGYGTTRRKDLTGSIATVSSKDFVQGQVTNPEQLVAGKIAGVQITSNGGAPGAGGTIRIRGGSSLNASNDPLIVIDGVPLDTAVFRGRPMH